MEREPVLKIKIEFNGESVHMKCKAGAVDMIPFTGSVEGPLFYGRVVPCGVDTQVVNAAGVRHMSARYMLVGKDQDGQESSIYVENNGWFQDGEDNMPFHTVPTFLTDSERLAPYLHCNQFVGEGRMEEDGLWIRFYEIER